MCTARLDANNVEYYPQKVLNVYAIFRVNRGHFHKLQYSNGFCKEEWCFLIGEVRTLQRCFGGFQA
jgi:hypothetical protein